MKPYRSPRQLRARIRAQLRRASPGFAENGTDGNVKDIHRFGPCELDMKRFELRRNGQCIESTTTEHKLLAAFVRNRGRLLTRERLLNEVWGTGAAVTDRVIDSKSFRCERRSRTSPQCPAI